MNVASSGNLILTIVLALGFCLFISLIFGAIVTVFILSKKGKKQLDTQKIETNKLTEKQYKQAIEELDLGINPHEYSAKGLAEKLEASFPLSYQVNVFNRMVDETDFGKIKILRLIREQKRYLLMASLLKNVPMFSDDVDEVWHQMLMFTKSYESFCLSFTDGMIHHEPNVDGTDGEDDRIHFDIMYHVLFGTAPGEEWGIAFRTAPSDYYIREWRRTPQSSLKSKYFSTNDNRVAEDIIQSMKFSFDKAESSNNRSKFMEMQRNAERSSTPIVNQSNVDSSLILPYIFWTTIGNYDYDSNLGYAHASNAPSSSSGCSSQSSCHTGSGGHSCSSGSSCGSSCSSGSSGSSCGSS